MRKRGLTNTCTEMSFTCGAHSSEIRHKPFPWGDGDTNLTAHIFGKPGGHHEEH